LRKRRGTPRRRELAVKTDRSHRGTWTRTYRQTHARHPGRPAAPRPPPFPHQRQRLKIAAERCGKPRCTGRHLGGACVKKGNPGRPRGHELWGRGQQMTFDVLAALQLSHVDGFLGVHPGDFGLAAEANCARSTVHQHLKDLRELGLVELRAKGGGSLPDRPGGKCNLWALTALGWAVKRHDAVLVPWLLHKDTTPAVGVLEALSGVDVAAAEPVEPLSEKTTASETSRFHPSEDEKETRTALDVDVTPEPHAPSADGISATTQPRPARAISKTAPIPPPWSAKLDGFSVDEIAACVLAIGPQLCKVHNGSAEVVRKE